MGEVTLTVPAAHVDAFRLATIAEVRSGGEWVKGMAEEHSRSCATSDEPGSENLADVRGSFKCLREDVEILEQLTDVAPGKPVKVRADASALAHIAAAMADKVISPAIASETNVSPFDDENRAKVDALASALRWAAKQAAHHDAIARVELQTAKAAA